MIIKESSYDKRMEIASLISKNNEGEQEAIKGYQELLSVLGEEDREAIEVINEIIADEKNHSERLNELAIKYDGIQPNED